MNNDIKRELEEVIEEEKLLFEEPELEFIKFSGADIVTASGDIELPSLDDDDDGGGGGEIDFPILDDEEEGGGESGEGGGGHTVEEDATTEEL